MAINERLIDTKVEAAPPVGNEAEQGLILHLDANDVDSYDGDGTEWVDISTFNKTIPLSDNADDLELHLNASDSTSYGGSGSTWTDIAGNYDGTISGAFFDIDNGGYFDFDGVNDEVNWSTFPTAFESLTAITMELWVKFDTVSGTQYPIWLGRPASGKSVNIGLVGGKIQTWVGTVGYPSLFTPVANKWYHLAVTISGTQQTVYVDGEDYTLGSNTQGLSMDSNAANAFLLGDYSGGTADFNGQIGQVRIYSKALSASEIGQNYRHGRDIVYTDLIPDTDLELHLDAASFPQFGESGYSNTPSTWTALTGNNGTITGATFDSELGNWLDFDGVNDKIDVPSFSPVSFEIWVNVDSTAGVDPLMGHSSITSNYVYWNTNDLTVNGIIFTNLDKVANEWVHIVLVESGSNLKCYKNGELIQTLTASLGDYNLIGARTAGTAQYISGKIGQVRIYSSTLTQDQVRQNYNFTKNNYPNGFDGTITGATWNSGGYFDFSGVDGSSRNKVTTGLTNIHTNFTVSIWVKIDSRTGFEPIFASTDGLTSQAGIILFVWSNNEFTFSGSNGTSASRFDIQATNNGLGVWHHVCCTQDSSNIQKLYINGELEGTNSTTSQGCSSTTLGLTLGGYVNATTNAIDGKISEFKIYDKALTASEITALFDNDKADFGL